MTKNFVCAFICCFLLGFTSSAIARNHKLPEGKAYPNTSEGTTHSPYEYVPKRSFQNFAPKNTTKEDIIKNYEAKKEEDKLIKSKSDEALLRNKNNIQAKPKIETVEYLKDVAKEIKNKKSVEIKEEQREDPVLR